jgi:hypothetical protein
MPIPLFKLFVCPNFHFDSLPKLLMPLANLKFFLECSSSASSPDPSYASSSAEYSASAAQIT